jgi:hypothetical protein
MRHYPTMDELAELLDKAIDAHQRDVERRLIESERRNGTLAAAGRSLANVVRTALRHGDITNTSVEPARTALTQWDHADKRAAPGTAAAATPTSPPHCPPPPSCAPLHPISRRNPMLAWTPKNHSRRRRLRRPDRRRLRPRPLLGTHRSSRSGTDRVPRHLVGHRRRHRPRPGAARSVDRSDHHHDDRGGPRNARRHAHRRQVGPTGPMRDPVATGTRTPATGSAAGSSSPTAPAGRRGRAFGGTEFTADPWDATREQQIVVAERVLARSGWGAWPGCAAKEGWR